MCSHNGREPGPKGAGSGIQGCEPWSDTRHTITSTRVDQLLIYNRNSAIYTETWT